VLAAGQLGRRQERRRSQLHSEGIGLRAENVEPDPEQPAQLQDPVRRQAERDDLIAIDGDEGRCSIPLQVLAGPARVQGDVEERPDGVELGPGQRTVAWVTVGIDGQEEQERLELTDDDGSPDQPGETGDGRFDGVPAQLVACPLSPAVVAPSCAPDASASMAAVSACRFLASTLLARFIADSILAPMSETPTTTRPDTGSQHSTGRSRTRRRRP
jgi:hypothetical protein